jgi:Tol biopolymer transport system component/DNA-binding winged helix-turn-helix (wHTH) protein
VADVEHTPRANVVRFGAFEADLRSGELRKHGAKLRLQEQPFNILATLLERPGEVVTRDELVKLLWPDGTFVDYDRGLNAAISRLRQVLSDSAENPRYVETVAKRGYRFIATVDTPVSTADTIPTPTERVSARQWLWGGTFALTLLAAAFFWWWRSDNGASVMMSEPVPLTSYLGAELHPSFSPDGTQVAFSWNGETQDNFDIYVKTVGSDPPRRLTTDVAVDDFPAWSPDGRYIAFRRGRQHGILQEIYTVAPTGGPERRLLPTIPRARWWPNGHAWSADGKYLAFSRDRSGDEPAGIFLLPAEGGAARRLTTAADAGIHEAPSFSPDGKYLAFSSCQGHETCNISILGLAHGRDPAGPMRELVQRDRSIFQIAWTGDAQSLVFAELRNIWGSPVWKVPLDGRQPERLSFAGSAIGLTISPAAKRIAFSHSVLANFEIWQLESAGVLRHPVSSTFNDGDPQFSPDGRKIVFTSGRSGRTQIWVATRMAPPHFS